MSGVDVENDGSMRPALSILSERRDGTFFIRAPKTAPRTHARNRQAINMLDCRGENGKITNVFRWTGSSVGQSR